MRLSLDTHVFLWSLTEDSRLSPHVRDALNEPTNDVFVSAVVAWEIMIKVALGKLAVPEDVTYWLPSELRRRNLTPLGIDLLHVLALERLPQHHRDPFDRLLLAQARAESLTIVSHDRVLAAYDVPVLWT
jgi:PIN domain nuclease of toxin-antitoxin system